MNIQEIKDALLEDWHRTLAKHGSKNSIMYDNVTSISGSTPPSVFVGSYNYPRVYVGPMLPPIHGDTSIFDNPEKWGEFRLEDILNLRLGMIRGIKPIRVDSMSDRYVEELQAVALSLKSSESDIVFDGHVGNTTQVISRIENNTLDTSVPFGPVGMVQSARFSGLSAPSRQIQNTYYDTDMSASDAMMTLYNSGIAMSVIQRCLSVGMLGGRQKRRLVPTKWSITAADSVISSKLLSDVIEYDLIDSCRVFYYAHLGNIFVIVLFPRRWMFELVEAWYAKTDIKQNASTINEAVAKNNGGTFDDMQDATYDATNYLHVDCATAINGMHNANDSDIKEYKTCAYMGAKPKIKTVFASTPRRIVFGSDWETIPIQKPPVNTAGAYYAARLAVLEYLHKNSVQAGALILREITPEYSVPVGVWQVREGVRMAMKNEPVMINDLQSGVKCAASFTNISHIKWLLHGHITNLARQCTISDYI